MLTEAQQEAANYAAANAVDFYRGTTPETEENMGKSPEEIPDTPVEGALRATVLQAMDDAFSGIANPVNPGQAQSIAADGAISGSGLQRDPVLGHLTGIEPAPLVATLAADYPKWVKPHDSWVTRDQSGRPFAQAYPDQHVARDNSIAVLVTSKEEEDRAMGAMPDDAPHKSAASTSNAGIGGADGTGAKTLYPAGSDDAENADPTRETEESALMAEETALAAEEKKLADAAKANDTRRAAADKARMKTTR